MKTIATRATGIFLLAALLAACDNNDDPVVATPTPTPAPAPAPDPVMVDFEVTVTNLTASQPLSPVAVIVHSDVYEVFTIGEAASEGLEILAEGGDNSSLIAEADAETSVTATASGEGIIPPGGSETVTVSILEDELTGLQLSAVTMLVNTNDAITGLRNVAIDGLADGDSERRTTITYDAGTEANTEAAGTIPGPADGGEGFNAARDDLADEVRGHTGVVSGDDGLGTSVLGEEHRWDNPTTRITITRVTSS